MIKKSKYWRCKQYTDWIKTQLSVVSMMPADDSHHVINVGLPRTMGKRIHDLFTIPVTRDEHNLLHSMGGREFERQHDISQAEEALFMINKALSEGLIEIRWVGE